MPDWNPTDYGPVFAAIFADPRVLDLGPGTPNEAMHPQLKQLSPARAFGDRKIQNKSFAVCCLAGAWLYHDFLNDSHILSQSIHSPSGSYWHAIMHRREPDYSNSKYWFERVGDHPIYPQLRDSAAEWADQLDELPGCEFLLLQIQWDPNAFVDLCAQVIGTKSNIEELCRKIQHREFELLFHYCHQHTLAVL